MAPSEVDNFSEDDHSLYIKSFRVKQCEEFIKHKCTQHRPYTCFNWHFMNQRRRRSFRKSDGSFNYSSDAYCTRYDEATGICPNGDDCSLLHKTVGDVEKFYHVKFYKTVVCPHKVNANGHCSKNGVHCPFAHSYNELRKPVLGVNNISVSQQLAELEIHCKGNNQLNRENYTFCDDPKWKSILYVYTFYKTDLCDIPFRSCRQGYACPLFHNLHDKRRSPQIYTYKSTPCPNVKSDDWGLSSNCTNGDNCIYCHTRTEQQFHIDVYKSTKCKDLIQAGYCPRGVFCAFAHVDGEMEAVKSIKSQLENGISLYDILKAHIKK